MKTKWAPDGEEQRGMDGAGVTIGRKRMFLLDRVQINTHGVVLLLWEARKENSYSNIHDIIAESAFLQPRGHGLQTQKSCAVPQSLQDAIGYSDSGEWKENKASNKQVF